MDFLLYNMLFSKLASFTVHQAEVLLSMLDFHPDLNDCLIQMCNYKLRARAGRGTGPHAMHGSEMEKLHSGEVCFLSEFGSERPLS